MCSCKIMDMRMAHLYHCISIGVHCIPSHTGSSPDQKPSIPHTLTSVVANIANPESHEYLATVATVVFSMSIWPFRGGRSGPQSICTVN